MQPRDIRNLAESYQSIYANQETLIEEMESGQHPGKSSSEKTRIKYETEKRRNSAPTGTGVPDKKTGYQGLKDSTDYYTLIKGHLIDEGFASSEENAEKIISVMSDKWISSIVEQKGV